MNISVFPFDIFWRNKMLLWRTGKNAFSEDEVLGAYYALRGDRLTGYGIGAQNRYAGSKPKFQSQI